MTYSSAGTYQFTFTATAQNGICSQISTTLVATVVVVSTQWGPWQPASSPSFSNASATPGAAVCVGQQSTASFAYTPVCGWQTQTDLNNCTSQVQSQQWCFSSTAVSWTASTDGWSTNGSGSSATFTAPGPGTYTVAFTVQGTAQNPLSTASASASCQVTVYGVYISPSAFTTFVGASNTFVATGSPSGQSYQNWNPAGVVSGDGRTNTVVFTVGSTNQTVSVQYGSCSQTVTGIVRVCTAGRKYTYAYKAWTYLTGVSSTIGTRYGSLCCEPSGTRAAYQVAYANVSDNSGGSMRWAQSGWGRERHDGSTSIIEYRYAEVQGNSYQVNYDTADEPADGSSHTYKCELNPATGQWRFFYDGVSWQQFTDTYWTNHLGNSFQYSGEIYNKEDDMPGTSTNRCRFQGCQYRVSGGSYADAGLTAGDVSSDDSTQWGTSYVDGTTFDIWDVIPGQ
jgi:hypothetical protein